MQSDFHPTSPAKHTSAKDDEPQTLDALIDGERLAMLTRTVGDGLLHSKPMTVLRRDDQGRFSFFVRSARGSAEDAQSYSRVNLAFSRPDKALHVSLAGHGQLLHDRADIHALWTPAAKPWFPDGPDAPDLAILRVTVTAGEYWDGPSSRVLRAFAMAASIAAGKPVGLGTHGQVDLRGTAHG